MNTNTSLHPIETAFYENAPWLLRNRVWEHIFSIKEAVSLLQGFPKDASFRDIAQIFEENRWLDISVRGNFLDIPTEGPLVVTANHPYPMIDAISMGKIIELRRKWPVKVISDSPEWFMPEWDHLNIPLGVSVEERKKMQSRAFETLENDGTLLMFPAWVTSYRDIVSHSRQEVTWKKWAIKFAQRAQAPILPLHVSADTSYFYNTLKNFFPRNFVRKFNLTQVTRENVEVQVSVWNILTPDTSLTPEKLREIVYKLWEERFEA